MSVDVDDWSAAWRSSDALTWADKGMLAVLAAHLTEGVCTEGAAGLAAKGGSSERTVQRRLSRLQDAGWITSQGGYAVIRIAIPETTKPARERRNRRENDDIDVNVDDETGARTTKPARERRNRRENVNSGATDERAETPSPSSPSPSHKKVPQTPQKRASTPSPKSPSPADADKGGGGREADSAEATREFAGQPEVSEDVGEQWLMSELADHGLQPRLGEANQILRRLHAGPLPKGRWREYLLDRMSSLKAKVEDGEATPRKAKSWLGRTDNVRWWLEDGPDGSRQSDGTRFQGQLDEELGDDARLNELLENQEV